VLLVAILLGLRHATDPDHLAAVTTLVAGTRERAARTAAAQFTAALDTELSRLGGSLEPFAELTVALARGRTFDVVTQVSVGHAWLNLRDSLESAATAWYLAELADRSLEWLNIRPKVELRTESQLLLPFVLTESPLVALVP
jgi:hypothetical protein